MDGVEVIVSDLMGEETLRAFRARVDKTDAADKRQSLIARLTRAGNRTRVSRPRQPRPFGEYADITTAQIW